MGFYSSLTLIAGFLLVLIARALGIAARAQVKARTEGKRVILFAPSDKTTTSSLRALRNSYRFTQQISYLTSYNPTQPCLLMQNRVIHPATEIPPFVLDKLNEASDGMTGLVLLELQPKRYASVSLPGATHLARFINTYRVLRCLTNWGCSNAVIFYNHVRVVGIGDPDFCEKSS
ncbi:hypothetical protein GL50803_0010901 [Giardia duodenalis]|uniref:Uncharacterized protein n=2 Tax=Giardia intestinalis TaxID=5741 RepID=D3KGJ1_GIAIC|nr:hypothetical protein GL50803_0010901 [Giardia intestinalis]ESU35464.1 Hypothetical protein DHA2_151540 [Giardia intestinalis]KAE8305369.1 hypothetical protein GL50803_0010901 [Giardia intestinalis]